MNDEYRIMLDRIQNMNQSLSSRFEKKLVVNSDLKRSLVSFQANKTENGFRWCKYKEGFSASLIRYILRQTGLQAGKILDPFAGSGTSLFVAAEEGLDAVGFELLPSAAEIITVRNTLRGAKKSDVADALRRFKNSKVWEEPGSITPFCHLKITGGAFPKESERRLGRYLYATKSVRDLTVRRVLKFAALCILESISYTRKDGQYLRWDSRSGRRVGKKLFSKGPILPFTEAIVQKLEQIADDLQSHGTLFDDMTPIEEQGAITIQVGSCLDIVTTLKSSDYDGIITSPPYCNRYDYTRTYALELAMLGISEDEIKELRQTMLTCTVENREKEDLEEKFGHQAFTQAMKAFQSQELLGQILAYLDKCRDDGSLNNNGIPRMVRNYFLEMALVIFECSRVLKPGAPFVMVNDNVRYQGAHIPVDLILSDIAEKAGFQVEVIWVLPRGKGNSSQQMGLHGREEIRKCVYVWRARGQRAKKRSRTLVQAR